MQSEVEKRDIHKQRVEKLERVKVRVDEIKAKMNGLERELLKIKELDRELLWKSTIERGRKETIYKSDEILFLGKLSYQRVPNLKLVTWEEAKKNAKSLKIAGHNDWRLPTIDELEKLLTKRCIENYKGESHYILRDFLNIMPQDSCFWSSTEENELYSWVIDFGKGYDYWRRKTLKYYALYVRKT